MGGSFYSRDDYASRTTARATFASVNKVSIDDATFKYTHDIKSGTAPAKVHATLEPKGVKIREARDSDAHPISVPVAVLMDTTGSMATVPRMLQKELTKLIGAFLDDKASGKKYLGEGYPAIMVGGFDDYDAMCCNHGVGNGTLQVGQFESGIEIDDNLTNLWLTGLGGGTYEEQYELALYFMARHTAHDHWDKRGRKGYIFLIGDEHPYPKVTQRRVADVIGDVIQADIPLANILKEAQQRYHVFMIIPALTSHYGDHTLERDWVDLLGQQNVIMLPDPNKICEAIVTAVAICEEHVGLEDIEADGLADGIKQSLVLLSQGREVSRYSADSLPAKGSTSGVKRI